jgi:hypothetical protein
VCTIERWNADSSQITEEMDMLPYSPYLPPSNSLGPAPRTLPIKIEEGKEKKDREHCKS